MILAALFFFFSFSFFFFRNEKGTYGVFNVVQVLKGDFMDAVVTKYIHTCKFGFFPIYQGRVDQYVNTPAQCQCFGDDVFFMRPYMD